MTDPAAGGGVLMETGSHLVDQVLYVLGATSASLCEASLQRHLGLDLASSLVAGVRCATGERVECSIELSMLEDLCNGIFIEFPNYVLKVGLFFEETLALVSRAGSVLCELSTADGVDSPTKGFVAEWRDFLEQCRSGQPSVVDAASVRHTTALIEAAYQYTQRAEVAVSAGTR
jgi:predicted dehydrogenase